MVKRENERDLMLSINHDFMSDQSEVEDDNHGTSIIKHPLPWRSKSLHIYYSMLCILASFNHCAWYCSMPLLTAVSTQ